VLLMAKGDLATAQALLREALAANRRIFGPYSLSYAGTLNSLAIATELEGRLPEAHGLFEESVRIVQPQLGDNHPRVLDYQLNLARVQIAQGRAADSQSVLRRVLAEREERYPAGDWRIGQAQSVLASALIVQHRYAEAKPLMLAADAALKPIPGVQGREREANSMRLAALSKTTAR
jgi:tetratricopeptide (TPR) repeat protein